MTALRKAGSETARTAKAVLASAACVTVLPDRESDIYAGWATLPGDNFHLLTRVMRDRAVADGGTLASAVAGFSFETTRTVDFLAQRQPSERPVRLCSVWASAPSRSGDPAGPA